MDKRRSKLKRRAEIKRQLVWYSFIIIPILTVIILTYVPTFKVFQYSFSEVSVLGEIEKNVGLKNYVNLLTHTKFPRAIFNTFILAIMGLLSIPIGFLLANMINNIGQGKMQTVFRVGFYLPHIIAGVSVVMILRIVLKGENGLFNNFLSFFAGKNVNIGWFTDSKYSRWGATLMSLWTGLGYSILINLASLQGIPRELYEAASVDGATPFQQMLHITIPNMKACFSFLFLMGMIGGFARFSDLYIIGGNSTAGSPGGTLQTMMMFIYEFGLEKLNYGISSAASVILFIVTLIFSLISGKASGYFEDT